MDERRTKCLGVLADFLKFSSCGWWFRVPMLVKKGKESAPIPSDQYLPYMSEPFGMSQEMPVRGLVCLKKFKRRAGMCRMNPDEWKDFKEMYKLEDLFEIEPTDLLGRKRQFYVKMGQACQQKGLKCIDGVKEGSLRMRRRICSGGQKRKEFVNTLLEVIASEWDDEEMEAWLTSDVEQVQESNKKVDYNESDST